MDNQSFTSQPQQPTPQQNIASPVANTSNSSSSKKNFLFLTALVVLIAAVIGVYLWQHNKVSNLQAQLDAANNHVTHSASLSSKQYLYLYKYGVKIPLVSSINDLYYVDLNKDGFDTLSFSTQSLGSLSPDCWATPTDYYYTYQSLVPGQSPPATAFGPSPFADLIIASKKSITASQIGATTTNLGHISGYYFYGIHQNGITGCNANNSTQNLASSEDAAFTAAIKNIQPIN